MIPVNETQLWITTQRETAHVIESFYKDNYSEQSIMQFKLKYRKSCNRSFDILMSNPKKETLEVQLSIVCSPYINNEEFKQAMEIATLRFFRNKLTVESKQSSDIFNVVYKKLEKFNVFPDENTVLQAWEEGENRKRIDSIESDTQGNSYLCSYVWLGDKVDDNLNKLYLALKENKLISDETDSVTFLTAFNGVKISTIKKKIKWTGTKKSCVYFINHLLQEPKFIDENNMWSKLEKLFTDKNGKPMDRGAKENQKIFGDTKDARLPSNYKIINSILKDLRD